MSMTPFRMRWKAWCPRARCLPSKPSTVSMVYASGCMQSQEGSTGRLPFRWWPAFMRKELLGFAFARKRAAL